MTVSPMPGIRIMTNVSPIRAADATHQAARFLGFRAQPLGEGELAVRKGSFAKSLFLGLIFPYCNFHIQISKVGIGTVEVAIRRNTPWWTGPSGVGRVQEYARELADAVESALLERGGEVLSRGPF